MFLLIGYEETYTKGIQEEIDSTIAKQNKSILEAQEPISPVSSPVRGGPSKLQLPHPAPFTTNLSASSNGNSDGEFNESNMMHVGNELPRKRKHSQENDGIRASKRLNEHYSQQHFADVNTE